MSFLVPAYLLGALAVALPIWFHLRRRPPRERLEFSSLMFLGPSPQPRAERRSRPENLWLLLLRCLALLLLVLAFSRPFFRGEDSVAGPDGGSTVVLLDASASVARTQGAWESAVEQAVDAADAARGPIDLLVYDHRVREAFSTRRDGQAGDPSPVPDDVGAAARLSLAAFEPGLGPSDLGAALLAATERLPDGGTVIVLSDFLEDARLESLRGQGWPDDVTVRLEPVVEEVGTGFAAYWLPPGADGLPRVRLVNGPAASADGFRLAWTESEGRAAAAAGRDPIEAIVPAGSARVVRLGSGPDGAGTPDDEANAKPSESPRLLRIEPTGRDGRSALELAWVPPRQVDVNVWCAAPEDDRMRFYLERALRQGGWRRFTVTGPEEAQAGNLDDADVAVITDALDPGRLAAVAAALRDGLPVLVAIPSATEEMRATLQTLAGLEVGLAEADGTEEGAGAAAAAGRRAAYALLTDLDFSHPFLVPFAEADVRDFGKVRFWHHRMMGGAIVDGDGDGGTAGPSAAIVARFDDGSPALLERTVGDGRLIMLASGWMPEDSQLGLSSKFVPLLFSIFESRGVVPDDSSSFFNVGDAVALARLANRPQVEIVAPDGGRTVVEEGGLHRFDSPGVHVVHAPDEADPDRTTFSLAVNPPESEARLGPLAENALAEVGVGVDPSTLGAGRGDRAGADDYRSDPRDESGAAAAVVEGRQQFWRWIIVGLFAILMGEAAVSGLLTRRAGMQPSPPKGAEGAGATA